MPFPLNRDGDRLLIHCNYGPDGCPLYGVEHSHIAQPPRPQYDEDEDVSEIVRGRLLMESWESSK